MGEGRKVGISEPKLVAASSRKEGEGDGATALLPLFVRALILAQVARNCDLYLDDRKICRKMSHDNTKKNRLQPYRAGRRQKYGARSNRAPEQ